MDQFSKQKSTDFAQSFGESACSSSRIQYIRARHGIIGAKMSGEAANVDKGAAKEGMSQKWPRLY